MSRRNFFRRGRGHRRAALFLAVLLFAAVLFCGAGLMQLRPMMDSLATTRVSNVVHKAVAQAVTETIASGRYDYSDLIALEKDQNGKITALTSNMTRFNELQIEVGESVMERVGTVSSAELAIPVGSLSGIFLLSGRGPDIHIKILSVGSPETSFENCFTDAGINQTRHRIVLHIAVTVRILMPGYTSVTTVNSTLAVVETVIVGEVPETYTYFHSDSTDQVQEYITNQ